VSTHAQAAADAPVDNGTAIVTTQLTRRFGANVAVDHVDLAIPKAQIYGFLGPNGSGKSTTFRMLCGLLRPSEGEVDVLGHRIPRDAERIRPLIGYMTQQFSLYRDLSVNENLDFLGRIQGLARRRRRERIATLLERYDLARLRKRRPENLSGGERQRLALAAAVLHEPPILLLDEPTSAVDPQTRREFWDSLFDLTAGGTTILVSTHYMDEAERCHRIAILDLGRLVAEGEPAALMRGLGDTVLEVAAPDLLTARRALTALPCVRSLTQLGSRLRVLVAPPVDEALSAIRGALAGANIEAGVEPTRAGLEDVFVASTGKH
jgi:ABC-2 type transport system ATP-binding protein